MGSHGNVGARDDNFVLYLSFFLIPQALDSCSKERRQDFFQKGEGFAHLVSYKRK